MIRSVILRSTARLLVPLLVLFSFYLLVEGHSAPGGGFPAGLIGAGAFALYAVAFGVDAAKSSLPASPSALIVGGLLAALASGLVPLAVGRAFLDGMWMTVPLPGSEGIRLDLGTPLLFDAGVYVTVVGAVLAMVFELEARHTGLFSTEDEIA